MGQDPNAAREFVAFGTALKEATRRLHALEVEPVERLRLTRRLLAITHVGKQDLAVAAERLRRLRADLDAAESGLEGGEHTRHQEKSGQGD